jgi:hypothetical protein
MPCVLDPDGRAVHVDVLPQVLGGLCTPNDEQREARVGASAFERRLDHQIHGMRMCGSSLPSGYVEAEARRGP